MVDAEAKDTISIYFVKAAVSHLDAAACLRALAAAGIQPAMLESPHARVRAASFAELWRAVAAELDDEFFGLDSHAMKQGGFAMLCHAVIACEDLGHALRRVLRGMRLLLDDIDARCEVVGQQAVLRLDNRIADPADRRFAEETFLVLVHGLVCWLVGQRIPVASVAFAFSRPAHAREYARMFCANLRFDAESTSMRFAADALARPVVQTEKSLRGFLRSAPQSVFLKYRNDESWSMRVRRRLRAGLGRDEGWPRLEWVAREFGLAPGTLRRRLEAEGHGFQDIKDQVRNEWATDCLRASTRSLDEIAAKLGFHDASSFHRAFRRWNGVAPGEYRTTAPRARELGAAE